MYRYDRNRQAFNLVNAIQPVYRNNGGGLFEFDRRKQHETADRIFEALTFSPTPELELAKFVRLKSVRRIAQFDDGEVRYGVHVELAEAVNNNSFRIFKDDNTGGYDFYLFSVSQNKAELVRFNLDACGIHLQDIFEQSTGLCLSF
ncbi:hypothetical protein EG703_05125 [Salmonella enterica]|uniref:Uncharacterized protein n=1 Tax=Salmonella enterica I TaxID=59201 RepID=A0A379Y249_SALET|nr:hypothetical protein [Salmonella enterica]SUI39662.1 Uncharacterised protein [Salmonella enterica subsp. enterica]